VSPRARVRVVVGLVSVLVAAATVAVTLFQTRGESTVVASAVTKPRAGWPPLDLNFGVRADDQARALAGAEKLYNAGAHVRAAAIFARYESLDARIGSAFASWPKGGLDKLKRLVTLHPSSALADLHLGWAYYWSGRNADAVSAWTHAASIQPDTPYAVDAESALHPSMVPGLPFIVTPLSPSRAVTTLSAAGELHALEHAATRANSTAKLLYGLALWNLKHPTSAERELDAAAELAPHDPTVLTAAAVAAFSKARPARAFGRLGPLTGIYPRSPVVRFHLGLLFLWTGQRQKAATQLRIAIADGPHTIYARYARALLASLAKKGKNNK
jgi:tetratricopeptide (TPR) repeat protein